MAKPGDRTPGSGGVMRFREETPEGVKRMRHFWIATAMLSVGAIAMGVSAWYGSRIGVVSLVIFQIAVAVLLHLQRNLTWTLLDHMREGNVMYAEEISFSMSMVSNHLEVIGRLYDLDPTAAEVYQDRFREAVIKRHPQYLEERAKQAGMN